VEGVKVAHGQITWGWGASTLPSEQILAEIAQAGYDGAPVNLRPGVTVGQIRAQFDRAELLPAPGYLSLGGPGQSEPVTEQLKEQASRMAAASRELDLTELYVASTFPAERWSRAAQVTGENATSTEELKRLGTLLSELGRITQREGVNLCFHNHVGSTVETRDEIDRLFAQVDRGVVFQGADIGHLAWAGADVVQFTKDYASSIKTLHLKDINPKVRATGIAEHWDYLTFNRSGIFAELGEGMVDFPAIFVVLRGVGFKGWIVVETDVTTKATPLASATISRGYLRSIGV
jgi:inosose dehydratase